MQALNKYKRGAISPFSLFAILFISRLVVTFTASSGFITGEYSPDIMISALISIALIFIASIPIFYAVHYNMDIFSNSIIESLYALYFIYTGAVNVSRFSYFAQTTIEQQEIRLSVFAAMIIVACTYAASLGIEALSRFASFIFVIVALGIFSITALSFKEFSLINLFPFSKNSVKSILMNSLIFTADSSEIILFSVISSRVNGKKGKPFYLAMALSVLTTALLIFFTIGSFGDAANLSAYPIFAMSQISTFSTFERLDSVYMAFWIFATFLKVCVYIYAAAVMLPKGSFKSKCVFSGVLTLLASCIFLTNNRFAEIEKTAIIISFIIFALIIPVIRIIFRKKSKGEELLERF